jgi:hypothetical protein
MPSETHPHEAPARKNTAALSEWMARYLAPLIALSVALSQLYLAAALEILTPARGGGFGLFSTVDRLRTRQVQMYWVRESGDLRIALPTTDEIVKQIKHTASLPTESKMRELAHTAQRFGRPIQTSRWAPTSEIQKVRIEVWKRAFDQERLEVSQVKLRELTVGRRE